MNTANQSATFEAFDNTGTVNGVENLYPIDLDDIPSDTFIEGLAVPSAWTDVFLPNAEIIDHVDLVDWTDVFPVNVESLDPIGFGNASAWVDTLPLDVLDSIDIDFLSLF